MKTKTTRAIEMTKNLFLLLDYFIWFIFDISKFKRIKNDEIKKVLIIHTGAIGELLVSTPLLSALKKSLNCKITYLIGKGKEDVLKNNKNLEEIMIFEGFKENVKKLKEKEFDLAIILSPGSYKAALMCLLSGIRYRIGCFNALKKGPALFYNRRVFPISDKHAVEKNIDMIRQIGIDIKNPKLEIHLNNKERGNAKKTLKKMKVGKYIIVHPGFGFITKYEYPSRLWPINRYAEYIDFMVRKYKVEVLLTGDDAEKSFSERIKKLVKAKDKVKVVCGKFNLREFFSIIECAELVMGPSTGTIHIATALRIPVVNMLGREEPKEWRPLGEKDKVRYLFHPEVCTGCLKNYCRLKSIECMNSITLGEVIKASEELMDKNPIKA